MWQRGDSERPSSSVTFQLDIHTFHLSRPRRPTELLPHRVISAAVSPDSPIRGPAREREGTPGTAAAAVRLDIQGWLIYGAGETLPLRRVSTKRRSWQPSLSTLLHHSDRAHGLLVPARRAEQSRPDRSLPAPPPKGSGTSHCYSVLFCPVLSVKPCATALTFRRLACSYQPPD